MYTQKGASIAIIGAGGGRQVQYARKLGYEFKKILAIWYPEAAAENPLGVFVADSIGAAIGSMASFYIPIVLGFTWFFAFASLLFLVKILAIYLFFRQPDRYRQHLE